MQKVQVLRQLLKLIDEYKGLKGFCKKVQQFHENFGKFSWDDWILKIIIRNISHRKLKDFFLLHYSHTLKSSQIRLVQYENENFSLIGNPWQDWSLWHQNKTLCEVMLYDDWITNTFSTCAKISTFIFPVFVFPRLVQIGDTIHLSRYLYHCSYLFAQQEIKPQSEHEASN